MLSKSLFLFLFCLMQDIKKYKHFAATYTKLILSFKTTTIMDAKQSKIYASFFLISLDKITSQL